MLQALKDQKASNVPDCTQESISLQLGQMEDLSPASVSPSTNRDDDNDTHSESWMRIKWAF